MSETFCQICRHPSDQGEGHYKNCPVYTGETVMGRVQFPQELFYPPQMQQQQGGLMSSEPLYSQPMGQSVTCPICGGQNGIHVWAGPGGCPGASTHWSQYGQSDTETRILFELADLRQEIREFREEVRELARAIHGRGR